MHERYWLIIKFVHNKNVLPKQNETVAVYTGQDCTIYGREVEFSCYVVGVGKWDWTCFWFEHVGREVFKTSKSLLSDNHYHTGNILAFLWGLHRLERYLSLFSVPKYQVEVLCFATYVKNWIWLRLKPNSYFIDAIV